MDDDDFSASEEMNDDDHHDSGLGLGGGDEVLDYLIYDEINKEANRSPKKKSGCLLMVVLFLVPAGLFALWKVF